MDAKRAKDGRRRAEAGEQRAEDKRREGCGLDVGRVGAGIPGSRFAVGAFMFVRHPGG